MTINKGIKIGKSSGKQIIAMSAHTAVNTHNITIPIPVKINNSKIAIQKPTSEPIITLQAVIPIAITPPIINGKNNKCQPITELNKITMAKAIILNIINSSLLPSTLVDQLDVHVLRVQ